MEFSNDEAMQVEDHDNGFLAENPFELAGEAKQIIGQTTFARGKFFD